MKYFTDITKNKNFYRKRKQFWGQFTEKEAKKIFFTKFVQIEGIESSPDICYIKL